MLMKRTLIVLTCVMIIINLPIYSAETTSNITGPELETYILRGLNNWLVIQIHVENTGDMTAHNVAITEVNVDGNVIFNFQTTTQWSKDLEPGEFMILDPNSIMIGFGKFTISMTVSCEEGASSTSTVTGLIFGPIIYIP